jgi:hypothetical protein
MSILSVLHKDQPGAAARTVATADDARTLGFTNVQTRYEPQTGHHTVTGQAPTAPDDASKIHPR